MTVSDEKIQKVATILWSDIYEAEFRGKTRGRFGLTREQLRLCLGVERLHASTIVKLQDAALALGLVIIDLDDFFPCVEVRIIRRYRRPPMEIFRIHFPEEVTSNDDETDDEED